MAWIKAAAPKRCTSENTGYKTSGSLSVWKCRPVDSPWWSPRRCVWWNPYLKVWNCWPFTSDCVCFRFFFLFLFLKSLDCLVFSLFSPFVIRVNSWACSVPVEMNVFELLLELGDVLLPAPPQTWSKWWSFVVRYLFALAPPRRLSAVRAANCCMWRLNHMNKNPWWRHMKLISSGPAEL